MEHIPAGPQTTTLAPPMGEPAPLARRRARYIARERRRDLTRLATALDEDRLRLALTPRHRLLDMAVVAHEAGLQTSANTFRPAGVLSSADGPAAARAATWLLAAACAHAHATDTQVSIPIPQVLLRGDLPATVAAALHTAGLAPQRLELRLAERLVLTPGTELLLMLVALRETGVHLSLDDFGMRVASLNSLRTLPVHAVHLDPSFTHDLTPGSEDIAIAGALLDVAHALDVKVIARGIDTAERLTALRQLGVDEGMGIFCGLDGRKHDLF